ncbi:metal-sensing transcriptional repressor [Pseudomonas sp. MC042]|uniref:Metal-sensing transcriptional repressor n=2 Tax=Pseudomonas chlororaphis group TaxID=136842 RepID=A0A7X1PM57_9PSED|nr:metal-sensing transcriptional repressor [Pseudomonas sessilinigenes]MQA54756.1 metal-sensing transcriptional repressor [Pseudomonas piscis]QXH43067.1 metal-sensing transcriptional repressor [Pseudomonas sessilinigenes]
MPRCPGEKERALGRARVISGQITALEQDLESDPTCVAVLQQLAAVRGAINGLMATVLESHLREEFPDRGAKSDSQRHSIDESISIVRSYLR